MNDPFVIIGNPGSRRVTLFQEALARLGAGPATLVRWIDFLNDPSRLCEAITPHCIVRIESPGQDFEVFKALLLAGTQAADAFEKKGWLSTTAAQSLCFDKGRIVQPEQWYRGFSMALLKIGSRVLGDRPNRVMQHPKDIWIMFDKGACHSMLSKAGIAVPKALPAIGSFDQLLMQMGVHGFSRVFIKLVHGSSASGVIAYQTDGKRHRATTTVQMVQHEDGLRLYNSRRLFTYEHPAEVKRLVDALCAHRVHVEQWIPKAGIDGKTFDLRVLTIAGKARHVVVRMSRGPMTNLHLRNDRDSAHAVRHRMGEKAWQDAMTTCEQAAACVADSLYCGIDLLITAGFKRHAVLEINAFGDLLPGAFCDGMDTYTAEILAMTGDHLNALPTC